jgi:hypothetical protein
MLHCEISGKMNKIWIGLAFAAVIAGPVAAQDYRKNFAECAKELGLPREPGSPQKLSNGHLLYKWTLHSEAQEAAFIDCLARKANRGSSAASRPRRPH